MLEDLKVIFHSVCMGFVISYRNNVIQYLTISLTSLLSTNRARFDFWYMYYGYFVSELGLEQSPLWSNFIHNHSFLLFPLENMVSIKYFYPFLSTTNSLICSKFIYFQSHFLYCPFLCFAWVSFLFTGFFFYSAFWLFHHFIVCIVNLIGSSLLMFQRILFESILGHLLPTIHLKQLLRKYSSLLVVWVKEFHISQA